MDNISSAFQKQFRGKFGSIAKDRDRVSGAGSCVKGMFPRGLLVKVPHRQRIVGGRELEQIGSSKDVLLYKNQRPRSNPEISPVSVDCRDAGNDGGRYQWAAFNNMGYQNDYGNDPEKKMVKHFDRHR